MFSFKLPCDQPMYTSLVTNHTNRLDQTACVGLRSYCRIERSEKLQHTLHDPPMIDTLLKYDVVVDRVTIKPHFNSQIRPKQR